MLRTEIFLIFLALIHIFGQEQAELEEICKINAVDENNFLSIPSDCKKWVACKGTVPVSSGSCPEQLNFNSVKQQCDFISCHTTIPSFNCPSSQYPKVFKQDEIDCKKYYSCIFGKITVEKCTTGNFDTVTSKCNINASCNAPACVGINEGFILDPEDCTKSYLCYEEELIIDQNVVCTNGEFFDVELQECMKCFDAHCELTGPSLIGNAAGQQCAQT